MTSPSGAAAPDRKSAILDAAAELFAERGFDGTAIDEIGERAGVTGPAIYRHFRGKDALLRAVVVRGISSFELPEDVVDAGLEAIVAHGIAAALDDPASLVTHLRERHRLDDDTFAELDRDERRRFRPWLDAIAERNPALERDEIGRRHRAVVASIASTAARPTSVQRATLERLLLDSAIAVLCAPPTPQRPTSPPMSPTWSVPATRRDVILAAAMRLFRERGYHGVSMDDIGEAVGITGPTIYFHYPSKLDVLVAAHERASVRTWVAVQDAVASATSASEALDHLAAAQLRVASEHGDLILVTSRELTRPDAADRARFEARASEIVELWLAVLGELRPGLDRAELLAVLTGVFPLMDQTAYLLGEPEDGVVLVRAWALGGTPT